MNGERTYVSSQGQLPRSGQRGAGRDAGRDLRSPALHARVGSPWQRTARSQPEWRVAASPTALSATLGIDKGLWQG